MFKDIVKPQVDETFKFAVVIVASVFLIITIAVSYEITQLI
jgi:hypothetical protein